MNTNRAAASVFLVVLFLSLRAAPVLAQEDSSHWWWSPALGLYASTINEAVARDLGLARTKGLLVLAVARNSPAEEAGVKPGDIIADWSPRELWAEAGKEGNVQVVRDGREQALPAKSRKMPDDGPRELLRTPAEARGGATYVVDPQGTGNFRTVTAALFRAQPGDNVVIKPGSYREGVLVPPGITIRAAEKSLARIESQTPWLLIGNGAVEFSEIVFSGAGAVIENGEKVTISDCQFLVPEKKTGLVVLDSKAITVARSTFRGGAGTVGISAQGSQILVTDSIFQGHGNAAIRLIHNAQAEITNNLLDGNAISMLAHDSEVVAGKNVMTGGWQPDSKDERPDFGLQFEKVRATLSKNVIRRHRYGIFVSDAPVAVRIAEGTVTQAEYGVVLIASPAVVSDSLIMQNLRDGIYISGKEKEPQTQPQEVSVLRNTLSGNEGSAIEIQKFSRVSVSDNLIEANGAGIQLDRSVGDIENNTVVLQRFSGINVSERSNVQIFNNIVAFNSFGLFVDVTAQWETGYNNIYGNLASTEFPLRDGNYGRADRFTTRDGKKVPIDVYPAYDLRGKTDLSVEPGFVKLGSDYNLIPNSPIGGIRGKGGRYLGAYAPASYVARSGVVAETAAGLTASSVPTRPSSARRSKATRAGTNNSANSSRVNVTGTASSAEAKALIERGNEYMKGSKWADAITAYQQAIQLSPNSAQAYNALGWAYNTMGRHGDAFAPLVKAIQLNSQLADAHYGIAYAYLGSDNYAKALGFLRTTVRLDPRNADARFSLGEAYLELGDKKGALEQYAALKDLDGKLAQDLLAEIQETP